MSKNCPLIKKVKEDKKNKNKETTELSPANLEKYKNLVKGLH